jgi:hypothetical protein
MKMTKEQAVTEITKHNAARLERGGLKENDPDDIINFGHLCER